mgnify:CR=1 FL=1
MSNVDRAVLSPLSNARPHRALLWAWALMLGVGLLPQASHAAALGRSLLQEAKEVATVDELPDVKQLRTGDIIVQTSASSQSLAIGWATKSLYTHVGMVRVYGGRAYVIEAVGPVRVIPLAKFIAKGRLHHYAIFRLPGLTSAEEHRLWRAAKTHLGKRYDLYFSFANKSIYCSELVHLAYSAIGKPVGEVEQLGDLDLGGPFVDKLLKNRWKRHPACRGAKTLAACRPRAEKARLITPASLAADPRLQTVVSTYPL